MKKLSLYLILGLMFCNIAYAEKYLCSYIHDGEPSSVVLERIGNFFKKSNKAIDRIIFEDEYAIVLENTYTFNGKEKPQTYTTLIDKKRLTFVSVGLEYQYNTAISEGKCEMF